MAARLFSFNAIDVGGGPASGALLNVYTQSTTTRTPWYTDSSLTTQATNPIVADSDGRISVYFQDTGSFSISCTTSNGATNILEADVVGGVLLVDTSSTLIVDPSWLPAISAPLGSNWPTALGADLGSGWATYLAAANMPIVYVANNAALTALTGATGLVNNGIYQTRGRSTTRDGGQGLWIYDSSSTTTANTGTILAIDGGGTGRFFRIYSGPMFIEWFGGSSDWGAALTAMWTAVASAGGVASMSPGGDYTFTTQASMPATENNVTWDIRGCKLRPKYASGATFKFGDGATQVQEITILGGSTIIDADSVSGGGVAQPVFEFRGVRSARLQDIRGSSFYQIAKWGDPADAVSCFNLWIDRCDINMRQNSNGGHSHGILANGGAGGLYFGQGTSIEADADGVASAVYLVHLTSAQGPARLDHLVYTGGAIFKNWDRVTSAVDARIVNLESDQTVRFDEALDAAHYIEAASGAAKGGCEIIRLAGNLGSDGSTRTGNFLRIKADDNLVFRSILVEDVSHDRPGGASIHITTSGSGVVNSAHIKGFHIANADPSSGSQRAIILDGDIDEALVDGWTIQHKTGATAYEYGVYNNTASTKSVRITANFTMDTYGTGVVYDPNIGDLAINRLCEINTDGTPRNSYEVVFKQTDFATSQTNTAMGVYDATGAFITSQRVPRRCRAVGGALDLSAAVAAGSLTVGVATGASIDTNLDIVLTSGTGGVVTYAAGSAALAAGDPLYARYTSDGSLTAGLDGQFRIRVQEM